ncbi:CBS domain-containing protein [Alkalilimnicola sp. S0819]|uniref:CBS domain-containing protein n=1 Tax=Alkalilimnicola sp. S0819 TaxID=2613922 RepID=UPI00126241E9|nr:CBS domain-containing protein [Alkalilimnicola sp. S0819]KAB7624380.1 CBS domain-containing protein [Alkalilimnicola sp. S0819]MPQ16207.1 CBS domain-containing protein [Alkalilimnicola sp. S0819]
MDPTLGELLHRRPPGRLYAVSPHSAIGPALAAMRQRRLSCLLVLRRGRLTGLLEAPSPSGTPARAPIPPDLPVARLMRPDPPTVLPSMTLAAALRLCALHQLRHLPIARQGRLLGLLDWAALALAAADALQPETPTWVPLVYGPSARSP